MEMVTRAHFCYVIHYYGAKLDGFMMSGWDKVMDRHVIGPESCPVITFVLRVKLNSGM